MLTANGQEHSGMIDMKVLMAAQRAHAAPEAPLYAPVIGVQRSAARGSSPRQVRVLFAIAIGTLAIAIGTAALALAMPRETIRGRVGPKARIDVAAPAQTPVTSPVVDPPAPEPVVAPVTAPAAPTPDPRPHRVRPPRLTRPISPPGEPREVAPPRHDPSRPRTIDELMNDALR